MINFVRSRVVFFLITGVLLLVTVLALVLPPRLPWGLEFSSGSAMDVAFVNPAQPIKAQDVRDRLAAAGFEGTTVQQTGPNSFFVRTARVEDKLDSILEQNFGRVRVDTLSNPDDLATTISFKNPVPADQVRTALGDVKGLVVSRTGVGQFLVLGPGISDSKLQDAVTSLQKRYGPAQTTTYKDQGDMALSLDFGAAVPQAEFQDAVKALGGKFENTPTAQNSFLLVGADLTPEIKGSVVGKLEEKFGRARQTPFDAAGDMALRLTFTKPPAIQEIRNELYAQSIFTALVVPSGENAFVLVGKNVSSEQQDKLVKALQGKFGDLERNAFDFNTGMAVNLDFGQTATLEALRQAVERVEPAAVAAPLSEHTFFVGSKSVTTERQDALVASLEDSFGLAIRSNFDFSNAVASEVHFTDPVQHSDVIGSLTVIPVAEAVGNRAAVRSLGPNSFLVFAASLPPGEQGAVRAAIKDKVGAFEQSGFDKPDDMNVLLDFGSPVNTIDVRAEADRVAPGKVSVESAGGNAFFIGGTDLGAEQRDVVVKALEDKFGPSTRTTYEAPEDMALVVAFDTDTAVGSVRSEIDKQGLKGVVATSTSTKTFLISGKNIPQDKRDLLVKGLQDRFGKLQSSNLDLKKGSALTLDFGETPDLAGLQGEATKAGIANVQIESAGAKGFFLGGKGIPKAQQDSLVKALEQRYGPSRHGTFNAPDDMAMTIRLTDPARAGQAVSQSLVIEKLSPNEFLITGQGLGSDKKQQAISALEAGISPVDQAPFDSSVGLVGLFTFSGSVSEDQIKAALQPFGYGNMVVQHRDGNTYYVRSDRPSADQKNKIVKTLEDAFGTVDKNNLGFSFVDAQIARRSVINTFIAVAASTVGILLYVWWAFRRAHKPFRFGVVTTVSLVHDVVIVIGAFALMAKFRHVEVDSLMIIGLLAVIGYSVNNTIVVLDRVRENLATFPNRTFEQTVNFSLNETVTRNLNTTITTVLAIAAVLLFGGSTIFNFMLVLLVGVIAGTYSSLVLSPNLLVSWEKGELARLWPFGAKKAKATPATE